MGNRVQSERAILEGLAVDVSDMGSIRRTMTELMDHIQNIDAQLGDTDKRDQAGRRLSDQEYWAWRRGAVRAKTVKLRQYRHLKERLNEMARAERGAHSPYGTNGRRGDLQAYLAPDLHPVPPEARVTALRGIERRIGPLVGAVRMLAASQPTDSEVDNVCSGAIDALCDLHALCTRRGWLGSEGVTEDAAHD